MKWIQLGLALMFGASAYLQLNDPDGMAWVILYLVVAEVCFFSFLGKTNKKIVMAVLALMTGICLLHLPGFISFLTNQDGIGFMEMIEWHAMTDQYPYIELSREFGGSLICSLALFIVWRSQKN
ncbi:MAG: transmembrane 220 family protein [Bacteroidia bacterium]